MPRKDVESRKAYEREYNQKKRNRTAEKRKQYRLTQEAKYTPEELSAKRRAAQKKWEAKNPTYRRDYMREYRKTHPRKKKVAK